MYCLIDSDSWKPETFIALLAFVVSIIAVGVSFITAHYQKLSTSATLLHSYVIFYESPEIRKSRKSFASKLLDEEIRNNIDLRNTELLLDFFEEIAYLTKREVLDEGMVWNHFFWFVERYYQAITNKPINLIKKTQEEQQSYTIYQEIKWLYEKLGKFDKKESRKFKYLFFTGKYQPPSQEEVKIFLKYESQLIINESSDILPKKLPKAKRSVIKKNVK
ncbi:MAG: hypothetical protein WA584_17935 [Pyrinomonadaceae bacterium]